MKKSRFRVIENLMFFLSQKQHLFGLCFIVSLIFITFLYKNNNLVAAGIDFESNQRFVRTFSTENNGNKKLLSCSVNIESLFGYQSRDLNSDVSYLLGQFKSNLEHSIDFYGIDSKVKSVDGLALFKVYTTEILKSADTINTCTYNASGKVLTGNENMSTDVKYILCDTKRMIGSENKDCEIFSQTTNDSAITCASYNKNKDGRAYCYSDEHICNTYAKKTDKKIFAVDKEFVDQYIEKRNFNKSSSGLYFYLFYNETKPTDEEVGKINGEVNCFQKFYNCDLTPYGNIENVNSKLTTTSNGNIDASEFLNVIVEGKAEDYYNNKAFKDIVNSSGMPLFSEDIEKRCCLVEGVNCTDNLCFSSENKEKYINYFKSPKYFKYIRNDNSVKFYTRNISKQTCKNYLPDCASTSSIKPLYEKIDGKINIKEEDKEEQNTLYKAASTSGATCLYAEGTKDNDKNNYSEDFRDNLKSYCSDLLLDEDGTLKLKYENGFENDESCFLKSCIDLNQDEIDVITKKNNTNNIYCSPYRYLRRYDKIGIELDLKFFPISNGKIAEEYYCDKSTVNLEDESTTYSMVFSDGIDKDRKENCYLRRCVSLDVDTLSKVSTERVDDLIKKITQNVNSYVASKEDFSANADLPKIDRSQMKKYCENRVFFTKGNFVDDNLNLLSCSEFEDKGSVVKRLPFGDVAFKNRSEIGNIFCVNFQSIAMSRTSDNIKEVADGGDYLSFVTTVFSTLGGEVNKIYDAKEMLPDFKFNSDYLRFKTENERNICEGIDNAMMFVNGDIKNVGNLNYDEILNILADDVFKLYCSYPEKEVEIDGVKKKVADIENPGECEIGGKKFNGKKEEDKGKIDNIKNNIIKKYLVDNLVDCSDYDSKKYEGEAEESESTGTENTGTESTQEENTGDENTKEENADTEKEAAANNITRVIDCRLNELLKNSPNHKDYDFVISSYDKCEELFKVYGNEKEEAKMEQIKTFYNNEGTLYLPVPLEQDQYKESKTRLNETNAAVMCNYEGNQGIYNKIKRTSVIGCYPLADDSAYINLSTDYYGLISKVVNADLERNKATKPRDFTFNYIPVLTRYVNLLDFKLSDPNAPVKCGEREGSSYKDKVAILTSRNIDNSGNFEYIDNKDSEFLAAAGATNNTNFHKYGANRYGNNVCVFDYKDLRNCMSKNIDEVVSDREQIRGALKEYNSYTCGMIDFIAPGCAIFKDTPRDGTTINYINYDKYQWFLQEKYNSGELMFCGLKPVWVIWLPFCTGQNLSDVQYMDFSSFANFILSKGYNYGGSVKDYYAYNGDYDHGLLGKFNILSSYRGSVIRKDSVQDMSFNSNFYENLNSRYLFANSYYKGFTTKQIIEKCDLSGIMLSDGSFNKDILSSSEKMDKINACLKKYSANFFDKKPNEEVKNSSISVNGIDDIIKAPLKNKANTHYGRKFLLTHLATVAFKVPFDNNGTDYKPFKMIEYIGNQEKYNDKNINCYFDNYGFPISNLKYCRGIFTTKEAVKNFDIYDSNSDISKYFLPESQCLRLPLASAPQPYFNLATYYNTPSLFSPTFILSEIIDWSGLRKEVDFKNNGISGITVNFFEPSLYFDYYFTSDDSNDYFKNQQENGDNNLSHIFVENSMQENLSTLKFSSFGTGDRVFAKSFAGKKSFVLNENGSYHPIVCVSTYIDTGIKSLNPVADKCDPNYTKEGGSCVVSDVENFVCVDRMMPTFENIYMKLDNNFSFRTPYINAAVYDNQTKVSDKYSDERFILESGEENPRSIKDTSFNEIQQFGLKFERSLCSQLDIEYFDYLEKLSLLAKDNETSKAIYSAEIEKINEVIKPNCLEEQGNVSYLSRIDITKGLCEQTKTANITAADMVPNSILLPINSSNLYLYCKNESEVGRILDRVKVVKNPLADKGHKEICISDSSFEEIKKINKEQKTFDYSSEENQTIVFNSTNGINTENNKCLLDWQSRQNPECLVNDYVYVEDNSLTTPIIKNDAESEIFVSEENGLVYRVRKIDCRNAGNISDSELANIHSFSDTKLEKVKYCYKGGYNYSGNVSKIDGSADYSCRCMKKSVGTSIESNGQSYNLLRNGIFSVRDMNKRELGLCIDLENTIPACEAISYKNPVENSNKNSNTSYEEQVKNMKFSKFTELVSNLFKDHSGYEDERWEHIWRRNQKMFNSIGSYSYNAKQLGHAEFERYPYCDEEDETKCFGKSKLSVGSCSGFYKNGNRKVIANCVKVGDKYEFRMAENSGDCIVDSCAGVGYTAIFNDLNTNEESLLKENKDYKNFTQDEIKSYINVENSLETFNTTNHRGEISKETIDDRGLFNGFAAWEELESDVVVLKQDAVECFTGYGPAGTNYIVNKFFPYIKNVEDSIDFRKDFSNGINNRISDMNALLKEQHGIFDSLVGVSRNHILKEGSLIKAIAGLNSDNFIYLHDNLPMRFCNQLGKWEETRDIYNNILKDGEKEIDPDDLKYYNKNNYYIDLKKDTKYLNNTILKNDEGLDIQIFERKDEIFNDGVTDYNDSINTKYCERLFCQALSMEEVSDIYGNYDIYDKEYSSAENASQIIGNGNTYYVTLDTKTINKYTPWRHLGGANWEATSAPRNGSNELKKSNDTYDISNTIIDNVITVNSMDKGSVKTLYLKKVEGICDNKYGYYNRGTKFVLDSFKNQFSTLKSKLPDNEVITVEEINSVNIGGAKTSGIEKPFRTCNSMGLWSGVYNSCFRACEMLDMYHTNFNGDKKYKTFVDGKSGDINKDFTNNDLILNGDIVSFNTIPSFDRFRVGDKVVIFNNDPNQEYKLGDYLTGGANWPKSVVGLEKTSQMDYSNNMRYIEVEGICDTTNPYNRTFVSNVDSENNSVRPKRRCYENGTWGPIDNLCVLFNTCNELNLNILDISNLLSQGNDISKMNKVINKKLLAEADCMVSSDPDCYKNTYNAAYINKGFETDGLDKVKADSIQHYVIEGDVNNLFKNKEEADSVLFGEFFTVNAGAHTNPTQIASSIYIPLNTESDSSNFAFNYSNSYVQDCGTNENMDSCPIKLNKIGYGEVNFYKMQCQFNAKDALPWKFTDQYLGNYIYPIVCDKDSSHDAILSRTRLFNDKTLSDSIENANMYIKESNFHILSYLQSKDRASMFKKIRDCKEISSTSDACLVPGDSETTQDDFSAFNISLPISENENRNFSSYQHLTYCDERYFFNDNGREGQKYIYHPIAIECVKDSNSKKGKFVKNETASFSADKCYPKYCGRDFNTSENTKLLDNSGSKFLSVQDNWTLSYNSEYGQNMNYYGESSSDSYNIDGSPFNSNIVSCDSYKSISRLNANGEPVTIKKAYVVNFLDGKKVDENKRSVEKTEFKFYEATKRDISSEAWRREGYISDISTLCVAGANKISKDIINGITVDSDLKKNRVADLDLTAFKKVEFCTDLQKEKCSLVQESAIASGNISENEMNTDKATAFATKYCVPMGCDGEVDLSTLEGFEDTNKNNKKIYLDYEKYQIGDYAIIEEIKGDFENAGNKTDPIDGSNVYVMNTYLKDDKSILKVNNNNWYLRKKSGASFVEALLSTETMDDTYGLVCKNGYDQYFKGGKVLMPTKSSISADTFGRCDAYIKDISFNKLTTSDGTNNHVKYTDTLKEIIEFINNGSSVSDATATTKFDSLLKTYIRNEVDAIEKAANGDFKKYVDYSSFVGNSSNINTIKNATISNSNVVDKYFTFEGNKDDGSGNTTTVTYLANNDASTKFSSDNMSCSSSNDYLFATSKCTYNGTSYIKIDNYTGSPSTTTFKETIDGKEVNFSHKSGSALYIKSSTFASAYKTAFNNAYATYIDDLLKNSTGIASFYNKNSEFYLKKLGSFSNGAFAKYTTYEDLKSQFTVIYKATDLLNSSVFTNTDLNENISNKLNEMTDSDKSNFGAAAVDVFKNIDDTEKTFTLSIPVKISNNGRLQLYTLKNVKVDKHQDFMVVIRNYTNISKVSDIKDFIENISIELAKDYLTDVDEIGEINETNLKKISNLTDAEITTIMGVACSADDTECSVESLRMEKTKEILSDKNTNNSIIDNYESSCDQEKEGYVEANCTEAKRKETVSIDLNKFDTATLELFKLSIERLAYANKKLENLNQKNRREDLVNKSYIEDNCVVFSDDSINNCYDPLKPLCPLLSGKSTEHFERLFIENYKKSLFTFGNSAPFMNGLFMALQCGVDGKWKLVGGKNATVCKKRCSGSDYYYMNPDGNGKYRITWYIDNLREGSKGVFNVATLGLYCSRGINSQRQHAETKFVCKEGNLKIEESNVYSPGYWYHYATWDNPAVKSHCEAYLLHFGGNDGLFNYYKTAATTGSRNNRGTILTCPNKEVHHLVPSGNKCGIDKDNCTYGTCEHYPLYHNGGLICEGRNPGLGSTTKVNCDNLFDSTATVRYTVYQYK